MDMLNFGFLDRQGKLVQLWIVYYKEKLFSLVYATAPYYQTENVDFKIASEMA